MATRWANVRTRLLPGKGGRKRRDRSATLTEPVAGGRAGSVQMALRSTTGRPPRLCRAIRRLCHSRYGRRRTSSTDRLSTSAPQGEVGAKLSSGGRMTTQTGDQVGHRSASSEGTHDECVALAAASTQRGRTESTATPAELVEQRERQPVSAHPDRMAECDRTAVDVHDVERDVEVAGGRDADRCERLVHLEQREVADREI